MDTPPATASDLLPLAEVVAWKESVKVKWGEESTMAPQTAVYSVEPYSFNATRPNGKQPAIKTFGSLLGCQGGILTIGKTQYRIHIQQEQQQVSEFWVQRVYVVFVAVD